RQQQVANRLGENKKQGKPRTMSDTASYDAIAATKSLVMPHHHLQSSPEPCHWGYFDASLKPVLTIASGDEVTIETVSGGPEGVPATSKSHAPQERPSAHAKCERQLQGHILTGPVAVAGA